MSLVGLRRELEGRGWDCPVMNLNENRRVRSPEYIDVQSGWDYLRKVWEHVWRDYAVHVRVNGETKKGYLLALLALGVARLAGRPALLTYCGGHRQSFFPAPRASFRHLAFALLFRIPTRIYCNSEPVKQALLTTGINGARVVPIPHFSAQYVQFTRATLPDQIEPFCSRLEGTFFLYVCYRKEYMLEFLAEAMRRFRARFPRMGFLLVGTSERELQPLRDFFQNQGLEEAVCITGSVSHDLFLTLLTSSLAYIRVPLTDGVCASVLEALTLGVPVLGSDNSTRPTGVELWQPDNFESLLNLMIEVVQSRGSMLARIPPVPAQDNTRRLADDLEAVCLRASKSDCKGAKTPVPTRASERKSGPTLRLHFPSLRAQQATEKMEKEISSRTTEEKYAAPVSGRSMAPVFVLGSPRSGTTLLYHMLLSSGGFAVYRSETHAFNLLETAYGDLSHPSNKRRLMKAWLGSKLFQLSGLNAQETEARVRAECQNGGDFLRIVMGEIARQQKVERWADCTPDHLLYLRRIKKTLPEALIIHIIRDGRDVALSMDKQGWIRPLPGDSQQHLMVSSLYWEWILNRGREDGRKLGANYREVHFERLIEDPRSVLGELSSFIKHDLNYDRILEVGIGSVREPNTSFQRGDSSDGGFHPVGRWKEALSNEDAARMETLIGGTLTELGYPLAGTQPSESELAKLRRMRSRYRRYFDFKFWLKTKTPIGKWFVNTDLSWL